MEPDTRSSRKKARERFLSPGSTIKSETKKNSAGNGRFYTMAVFPASIQTAAKRKIAEKRMEKNKLSSGEFKPPSKAWSKRLTTPGFNAA